MSLDRRVAEAISVGRYTERLHPRQRDGEFANKPGSRAKALAHRVERAIASLRDRQPSQADYQAFYGHFEAAMANHRYAAFVSHYTPAEMAAKRMRPITANNGQTGILIYDHGNGDVEGTALYNTSDVDGAGLAMLSDAVKSHGVNYLECYGEALRHLYERLGFEVVSKSPFDDKLAASNWDYERNGRPDYFVLRHPSNPNVR